MMKVLKKLAIMTLVLLIPISAQLSPYAYAINVHTAAYNGFEYDDLTETTVGIKSYGGSDTVITVPSEINGKTVTAIKNNAFKAKADITGVTIPSTVISIGNYAFSNCTSLSAVTFLSGQTEGDLTIGERAFQYCTSLRGIQLPNRTKSIGNLIFYNSALTSITLPGKITSIPTSAFDKCIDLTEVTFAPGTVSIGNLAFWDCTSLTEISFPKTVKSLGVSAFQDCTNLSRVNFSSESGAHENLIIGQNAFLNCQNIKDITIPQNTSEIGNGSFKNTGISTFTVPQNVKSVGDIAFKDCKNLETVIFEQSENTRSVTLGDQAFYKCAKLKTVDIPENVAVKIGWGTFEDCTALIGFTHPLKATAVLNDAFRNCKELNSIVLQDGLTSLGERVFKDCSALTSFTVPNGIEYLPKHMFYNCSLLSEINIPDSVALFNDEAFRSCTSLKAVKLPKGLSRIGSGVFRDCSALESIQLPNRVKYIDESAFYGCGKLDGITTPQGITVLGANAFYNCSALKEFVLPAGITGINEAMFYNCTDMTKIYIGCNVSTISSNAFQNCSKLSIHGESGSYAESFALANGFDFVSESNAAVLLQIVRSHELDGELSQDDVFSALCALNCDLTQLTPELKNYADYNNDGSFDLMDAYLLHLRILSSDT